MKITVQTGIDASNLQQAIYQTIAAGMECDAHAARQKYQAKLKLMGKRLELPAQASLFGGDGDA